MTLDPPYDYPSYGSTVARAPRQPLHVLPDGLTEQRGPVFGEDRVSQLDSDLTRQHEGAPLGERLIVWGHVNDCDGRPLAGKLVEVWQANSAGRYAHEVDQHQAPLDPNFSGAGRCLTDAQGRYRFVTVRPGSYPWRNHPNAWRPAHIHFSFFGRGFTSRLVTQMYFPGDPLLQYDPMYQSISDPAAAATLLGQFDLGATVEDWALGYRFDVVLGGRRGTPTEAEDD
jgi:protocatechuate 3,4-dioxygenase beta subunit